MIYFTKKLLAIHYWIKGCVKVALVLTMICFGTFFAEAQIVISSSADSVADNAAMLDVQSSGKGVLTPRMTTIQRLAISLPATGLLVYDTDTQSFWFYNGSTWDELVTQNNIVESQIADNTGDTKIETEAAPNEDLIRLSIAGTNKMIIRDFGVELLDNDRNTFIGNIAGLNNTGTNNTFLGSHAGTSNTTGSSNSYLGDHAGASLTGGSDNTFIGQNAGKMMATGQYNTIIGAEAGSQKTGGDNNVLLGYGAGQNNGSGTGNIFIGYQAGMNETGSNLLYIANSSTSSPLIYGNFGGNTLTVNGYINPNEIYLNGWLRNGSGSNGLFFKGNGSIGIGTDQPPDNNLIQVAGDMKASGFVRNENGFVIGCESGNRAVMVTVNADGTLWNSRSSLHFISDVVKNGTGDYTINFVAGTFSAQPVTMAIPGPVSSSGYFAQVPNTSTSSVRVVTRDNNGTVADAGFQAMIIGQH